MTCTAFRLWFTCLCMMVDCDGRDMGANESGLAFTTRPGTVSKNRGTWMAVIPFYDAQGHRRRKSRATGVPCDAATNRGRRLAIEFLHSWQPEFDAEMDKQRQRHERRISLGRVEEDVTLDDYSRIVLDRLAKDGHAANTVHGYESCRRRVAGTKIGLTPIRELGDDPVAIGEFYSDLRADGYSPVTIKNTYIFLKMVLNHAVRERLVSENPFKGNAPKKARKVRPNALSVEDRNAAVNRLVALLDVSGYSCPRQLIYEFVVALMTGMRRGELAGLRWVDVTLGESVISVNHALVPKLDNRRTRGGYELSNPKNDASVRQIPMGPGLCDLMARLKDETAQIREALDLPWDDCLYVFGDPVAGTWRDPGSATKRWAKVARDLGLVGTQGRPPTLHDLRHTFATVALAQGMDVKTVSSLLGHASTTMTLDIYADALDQSKRSAMSELESGTRLG